MVGRRLQVATSSEGSTLWSEGGKTFSTRKNVWLFFGKGSILKMAVSDPKKRGPGNFCEFVPFFWDGDLWSVKKVKWLYKWGIKRSLWITWVVQIGWKIPTWHLRKSKIRTESIDFLILYSPIAKKSLSQVQNNVWHFANFGDAIDPQCRIKLNHWQNGRELHLLGCA